MNLAIWVERHGRQRPDDPALAEGERVHARWAEFATRTAGAAAGLRDDLGLSPGDRVAILMRNRPEYLEALFAVWHAGLVAVPVNARLHRDEIAYILDHSRSAAVVSDADHAGDVESLVGATASLRAVVVAPGERWDRLTASSPAPLVARQPEDPAWLFYTSGTTGRPKGVVVTAANYAAQIESLLTAWEWTREDRALLVLPLHHVHGIVNVLGCALAAGAACDILPQFETEPAWERLASGEITVFSAVPTIYRRLIQSFDAAPPEVQRARAAGCRRVRLMMSGSAALPVRTLERWRTISGHTLLERYGMTETGMILSNPLHGLRRPGLVGTPLPGVEVRLVEGEIEVRGPGVFREYWRRPDETRDAFHDGWFRTGDVAVLEDGSYRLLGRSSVDIIKTGGYKVSALEIEEVIREHPSVSDCAVTGVPDDDWGERVSVDVELRAGAKLTLEELRDWMKDRLAPYKVPKELRPVQALPRNAMGKVVKKRS
jgi:malonyl-CoA/methylmalonyl-CoA synthetase